MTARALQLEFDVERDEEYAARMLAVLVPIARELGLHAVDRRVTVTDLRLAAEARGLLTGAERGRRLSFIHDVMPKAGFEPTAEFRRSTITKSHRNLQRVWYLPDHSESHL